jgi:DNA mismatch endonuclease, patch repair protein
LGDFLTRAQRSERMARIRSRDTSPEWTLRRELHRLGYRYRLNVKTLPGKPDLVFSRYKTAIFVHGCFWHRHTDCKVASNPKSNIQFWQAKFERNVKRDEDVVAALSGLGWRVLVVWECELQNKSHRPECIRKVAQFLSSAVTKGRSVSEIALRMPASWIIR